MTGCIYMYTNKINGMKYVGQTINIAQRKSQHRNAFKYKSISYFDRALHKYGEDNFVFEILENNIEFPLLDEKEIFYIKKYNSFENGYNLTHGGQFKDKKCFDKVLGETIVNLIKTTKLSFLDIGLKYNISIYTVSDINRGYIYHLENEQYPIRKQRCSQLFSEDDAYMVIDLLKTTSYSLGKIAELTETNINFVYDINRGKRKVTEILRFPIRKSKNLRPILTKELVSSVIQSLKENNKSAEQIGLEFNLPTYTIGQINRGKLAICKTFSEVYPIQKKQYRSKENYNGRKITDIQLKEILLLLLDTKLSLEEIARRYNVDRSTIDRINRGVVFKKELQQLKFPVRQNYDYNKTLVV